MSNETLPAEYQTISDLVQKEEALTSGLMSIRDKIMLSACEEVHSWSKERQDTFLQRTALAIAKDENLKPCFSSAEGKLSIVEAVHRSVSTGLEIGGIHAYLVPQGRTIKQGNQQIKVIEARYSIRDRGYHALLCGGKRPIFQDLRYGSVYEKDDCSIDGGSGDVKHNVHIGDDRGKLIGVWVQAKKMNGQLEATFYPRSKIDQWMSCSKFPNNTWGKWYDEMALQSSIRHFSDRYEQARELIASAIYDDEMKATDTETQDIEERAEEILDVKLQDAEPVEKMGVQISEEDAQEYVDGKEQTTPEDGSLF